MLAELPAHQGDMALFALATGLRQRNVICLKWSQLALGSKTGYVAGEDAKCGEDINISLIGFAVAVMTRQQSGHPDSGFAPIKRVNTKSWRGA